MDQFDLDRDRAVPIEVGLASGEQGLTAFTSGAASDASGSAGPKSPPGEELAETLRA
jgi:hypothetical protein